MMAVERIRNIHIPPGPPTPPAGRAPAVSPIYTPPKLCEWFRQRHIIPPLLLPLSRQRLTTYSYGQNFPMEDSLSTVEPAKRTRFCGSFCAEVDNIAKVISTIISAAADGHWTKWDAFCRYVALDPYLSRIGTRSPSSTPLQVNKVLGPFPQAAVKYNPEQLRTPHGRLYRLLPLWVSDIPASQSKGGCTSGFTSITSATAGRTHPQSE